MIDTDNWMYLYKLNDLKQDHTTNMLYTPLVNPEKNIMCMLWDENSPYQNNNQLTKELVNFFFERELKHLSLFQGYSWAPKLIDVEIDQRKIFIEWNKESMNHIIFGSGHNKEQFPIWKKEIRQALREILELGYYKMALYPHCFFIGADGHVKTIDFYSCVGIQERYIPFDTLKGIVGVDSTDRFKTAKVDNQIDFKIFFENTIKTHLGKVWPDNPFNEFYESYYGR